MNEHRKPIKDSKLIYSNQGYITYREKGIDFMIAKLTYELFENESYQYTFEPFYDVIDAFDGLDIPGNDLELREKHYYRTNMTPVFISERVIPKNRVNLLEEMKAYQVEYYQPFLMLLDSNRIYGGDHLSLKSTSYYQNIIGTMIETKDVYKSISNTLKKLASRVEFTIGQIQVNESNRTILIRNYLHLYGLVSNYYENKIKAHRGRQKQVSSLVVLKEVHKQYKHGLISIDEAVKKSGLGSKRTYYRRVKELLTKRFNGSNE